MEYRQVRGCDWHRWLFGERSSLNERLPFPPPRRLSFECLEGRTLLDGGAVEPQDSGVENGKDGTDDAPPRIPSLDGFSQPWHIRLPRQEMLAAWERLKLLEIPGKPVDQRFEITGSQYYVSPSGDDTADGSIEHPWETLEYAVGQLKPNSVVYVMPGTYYGPVTISTSGTETAPAALRALDPGTVFLTYSDNFIAEHENADHYSSLVNVRGTYTEVSGFHLIGVRDLLPQYKYSENGVTMLGGGGEGCRVLYNEIEAVGHSGIKEMNHGGHSYLIEGNYIHDVGHTRWDHGVYTPTRDAVVRKNLVVNAAGYGVHVYSTPERLVVTHNILAGNDQFGAVQGGPDALIAHNVFYHNNRGGVSLFRSGCKNVAVKNNLLFEAKAFDFDEGGFQHWTPSDNVIDYNLLAPGTTVGRISPLDTYGTHNISVDPLVADADEFDFRVLEGSPCIDAGDNVGMMFLGAAPNIGLYAAAAHEVVDRYLFYNHSSWDDSDPSANADDDNAIATDKRPLLPGQTATLVNYSSFDRGINGIMLDVFGLAGTLTSDDFTFRVGNSNDASTWVAAPAPQAVTVRPTAGTHGSARVTVTWADSQIQNEWLQVAVLANDNTRLPHDDVFWFGNAIGEAGDAKLHAVVNATDEIYARNRQHGPFNLARIDDLYDFNRDRLVNATDQIIARVNQTSPFSALRLITPATVAPPRVDIDAAVMAPGQLRALSSIVEELDRPKDSLARPAEKAIDKLLATYWR